MEDVLCKLDQIISKAKSKYRRKKQKVVIQVPKTVNEEYKIDQETGTTFLKKAIEKEMSNVCVNFLGFKWSDTRAYDIGQGKIRI